MGAVISLEQQERIKPIFDLEAKLEQLPQLDLPVHHDFCPGLYARTLIIPAGTCLTGAIHREYCFFLIRSGSIVITTEGEPQVVSAGYMSVAPPHSKRAGLAITDVVCTTFHANPQDITDPDALWDMITVPPPASLLEVKQ